MTAEEAKMLLSARRPGGEDDDAPEMAEALALAAGDPELRAWLAEENAFDSAITDSLRGHLVSPELRARILTGMSASLPQSPRKITRRVFWWSAATAAAAAVAGGLFQTFGKKQPELAQFRTEMLDFFNNKFSDDFDLVESDPAVVGKWLQARPQAIAFQPLGNLREGKTIGCKVIPWRDTNVTLVCFRPPSSRLPIHIFAVQKATLATTGAPAREFVAEAGWNTILWNDSAHTMMAISKLPEPAMTQYLQT